MHFTKNGWPIGAVLAVPAIIFVMAAFAIFSTYVGADEAPTPAAPTTPTTADYRPEDNPCGFEDVLAFELMDPAYDLPAGHVVCIHIDQARESTPENVAPKS